MDTRHVWSDLNFSRWCIPGPPLVHLNLRPYLDIFKPTGSPCHELTSCDNSTLMRIWLGRKESQCEDILPVSFTDGTASSTTISLALPQLHKVRTYKEYHRVCPSLELGLPPTPHPQASVPPPPCFWGEGNTRWRERGWESPNSDEGRTLWYSFLYVRTLCSTLSVTHYEMWNKRKLMRCSIAPCETEKHYI